MNIQDILIRGRRQGTLHELVELVARLPWWAGLLAALAVYAVLHPLAMLQMPTPMGMVATAATALAQLLLMLARIGQYLLPLAFLIAAAISAFIRWKRTDLHASIANDLSGSMLRGLSRPASRMLVSEAFRRQGYQVTETVNEPPDGEIDLQLVKDGSRYLVQLKDWKAWQVGVDAVRELHRIVSAKEADGGFAVISGHFTAEARHFAADKGLELVDGRHLKELVRAERESAHQPPAAIQEALESALERLKDLVPATPVSAPPATARQEPSLHPPTAETPRGDPALDPTRPGTGLRDGSTSPGDEEAERAVGRELSALIRGTAPEAALVQPPPLRPRRPGLSRKKLADVAGMAVAATLIWLGYRWVTGLPDAPVASPWELMGSGQTDGGDNDLAERLRGLTRWSPESAADKQKEPLGQFQFGLSGSGLIVDKSAGDPAAPVYRSIHELETAFNAQYVPPPECSYWASTAQIAKCGNHRIRTRRAFIASGGKITPALLGGVDRPEGYEQGNSDLEYGLGYEEDLGYEGEQEYRPYEAADWEQAFQANGRTDWQEQPRLEVGQDPEGEQGQPPETDWQQNWPPDSQPEPAETAPLDREQGAQPEWPPDDGQRLQPEAEQNWREDIRYDPEQDWRQESRFDSEADSEQSWQDDSPFESDSDWRREWQGEWLRNR